MSENSDIYFEAHIHGHHQSHAALAVCGGSAHYCSCGGGFYTNHTVGGDAGWFFNSTTNKTSSDFSLKSWAANQTFNLGDFLIFNTNTNQTVIKAYNKTTYGSCTMDDALDTDTVQYDSGSNDFGKAMTIVFCIRW